MAVQLPAFRANNGAEGWELVGAVATGALVGGAIGAAVGAGVGLAATGAAALGGGGAAAAGGIMASGGSRCCCAFRRRFCCCYCRLIHCRRRCLSRRRSVVCGLSVGKMDPWKLARRRSYNTTGRWLHWRGPGEVGSEFGDWYNPATKDQLHPNLKHPLPKGPHWGWRNKLLRIFEDILKSL